MNQITQIEEDANDEAKELSREEYHFWHLSEDEVKLQAELEMQAWLDSI